MCSASGTVTPWVAPPRRCRSDSSVRSRSPSQADRSSSIRARRWRSSRSSPRKVGRSPGTNSRRCSGRTRTTRRPAARSGAPCRRCGSAVGDSGLLIDRARVALDLDQAMVDLVQVERLGSVGATRGSRTGRCPRPGPVPGGLLPAGQPGLRRLAGGPGGPRRADGGRSPRSVGRRSAGRRRHAWRGGCRGSKGRRGPARRTRPASTHRAPGSFGRPQRRDPPVPVAGRGLRPGARRGPAARDDGTLRIHPRRPRTDRRLIGPTGGHHATSPQRARASADEPAAGADRGPGPGARGSRRKRGTGPGRTAGWWSSRARPGSARPVSARRSRSRSGPPVASCSWRVDTPGRRGSPTDPSSSSSAPDSLGPTGSTTSARSTRPPAWSSRV